MGREPNCRGKLATKRHKIHKMILRLLCLFVANFLLRRGHQGVLSMSYSAIGRGIGFLKFGSSVVSRVLPFMITVRILRVARMSARGSPSIRMMSAILPAAIVPRFLSLWSSSAGHFVDA